MRPIGKQALQQLNDALDSADEIKLLLEQDAQDNRVPGLAFRNVGMTRGGVWDLNAAWEKRPRVLKSGGISTYIKITAMDQFGENDDLIDLSKAVIPYADVAR